MNSFQKYDLIELSAAYQHKQACIYGIVLGNDNIFKEELSILWISSKTHRFMRRSQEAICLRYAVLEQIPQNIRYLLMKKLEELKANETSEI